jgi:serine protease Do
VVVQVAPHGPAEKSGIKSNDVITEVDGKPVKSIEELVNIIGLTKPGVKVALTLYREGKKQSINIAVGDWPGSNEVASEESSDETKGANGYGLELNLVKYEERWALKVEQVASNSSAARAGMQAGDIILGINGYNHNKELMEKFRKGDLKDTILLLVEREYGDRRTGIKGHERFLISLRASK